MQPQFINQIIPSFVEYLNYEILNRGNAFSVISTGFYPIDTRNTQVYAYASPLKPFIADNGISGVQVISGISGNGVFYNRASGISIDYLNGRILSSIDLGSQVSGTFSLKDVNIKYTSKNEDSILMDTKYVTEPIQSQQVTGIAEDTETYPVFYVNLMRNFNEPANLGGLKSRNTNFNGYIVADSPYLLDAVIAICEELTDKTAPLFELSELPYTVSGDLKDVNYSYTGIAATKSYPNTFRINKVNCSKLPPEANSQIGDNVFIGVVEFDCVTLRQT